MQGRTKQAEFYKIGQRLESEIVFTFISSKTLIFLSHASSSCFSSPLCYFRYSSKKKKNE